MSAIAKTKEKILDMKSKTKDKVNKRNGNHRLINICFVAFFSLIILFTLVGGVNVDVGSTVVGDGNSVVVRQNYFQVVHAAVRGIFMSDEDAVRHVNEVNAVLVRDFEVLGLSPNILEHFTWSEATQSWVFSGAYPAVPNIDQVGALIERIIDIGKDPSSINWVLYRYAFVRAVMFNYLENPQITIPELDNFRASWSGNMAVVIAGQTILRAAFSTMVLGVSIVMLILAVIALVKKKSFSKARLSFILLAMAAMMQIVFNFNFLTLNWAWILVIVFTFVFLAAYILIQHILMDNRDFSLTMFIHNIVFLTGGIISLVLLTGPLFRVMSLGYGDPNIPHAINSLYGINLLYDLSAAQTAYMATVPMSYLLTLVVVMVILGLPFVMNVIFLLVNIKKFINADYTYNERRIMLGIFLAVNIVVFILLGVANIGVSDLYLSVSPLIAVFIIQPLIVALLLVFEILYKVKPVRKELVVT